MLSNATSCSDGSPAAERRDLSTSKYFLWSTQASSHMLSLTQSLEWERLFQRRGRERSAAGGVLTFFKPLRQKLSPLAMTPARTRAGGVTLGKNLSLS